MRPILEDGSADRATPGDIGRIGMYTPTITGWVTDQPALISYITVHQLYTVVGRYNYLPLPHLLVPWISFIISSEKWYPRNEKLCWNVNNWGWMGGT